MPPGERSAPIPPDIESQPFDLIIIGAGINGAGIARDAAMRGLRTLLLDKADIGGGTTPWSTRLIHGGLRYLEYFEFPLVRESLRERERLLRIAPHLVSPLQFLVPIYKDAKRGTRLIQLGMIFYDVLSYDKSQDRHRMLNRQQTLELEPGLNPDGLQGAALYYDAQITFPERLTLENALSARDHGATVLTYARVDRFLVEGSTIGGVRFTDLIDGGEYTVRAPVTVNVTGPWVDEIVSDLQQPRLVGGTKGSHIIVDRFPGAPDEALYVEANEDGRPYFIVPWNDQLLIGTTDIRYSGDLDRVVPDEDEIDYLISDTNRVIPPAHLTREHVRYAYAGVRPLPYQEEGAEGSITRAHIVHDHAPDYEGLISIIGGKLTTYRNLAEQTTDLALKKLNRRAPRARTDDIPLPGANTDDWENFSETFMTTSGLDAASADRLLHIYGIFAQQVLEIAKSDPALRQPFSTVTGALAAEIVFTHGWEAAETLEDMLLRRTMVGLNPEAGLDAVDAAAEIAQKHLGWSAGRAREEAEHYRDYVTRFKPRQLASSASRAGATAHENA